MAGSRDVTCEYFNSACVVTHLTSSDKDFRGQACYHHQLHNTHKQERALFRTTPYAKTMRANGKDNRIFVWSAANATSQVGGISSVNVVSGK